MRIEVDDDPLDRRLVRVVADEEAEAVFGREQVVPAPELPTEHCVDQLGVRLEGLGDALVPLAETNAERAEREAALRPRGSSLGEAVDVLDRDAPALLVVGTAERGDLHLDRQLEAVGVGGDGGRDAGVETPLRPRDELRTEIGVVDDLLVELVGQALLGRDPEELLDGTEQRSQRSDGNHRTPHVKAAGVHAPRLRTHKWPYG